MALGHRLIKRVAVVGGGIVGTCSAIALAESGYDVTVVDARPANAPNTSTGNAGMIVPSHFTPMATMAMVRLGLKLVVDSGGPFGFSRFDIETLSWGWKFLAAARSHKPGVSELLRDLHLASRAEYLRLGPLVGGVELRTHGLLALCKTQKALDHEAEVQHHAANLGLEVNVLSRDDVSRLEPGSDFDVCGAVQFVDDAHIDAGKFLMASAQYARTLGVRWISDSEVKSVRVRDGQAVALSTTNEDVEADEFVFAAGVWTKGLADSLGLQLPLLAGKVYSFTQTDPSIAMRSCALLIEARSAVTPLEGAWRLAGTREMGEPDPRVNQNRLKRLKKSFRQYIPSIPQDVVTMVDPWVGFRPCSPDGLPYIGRARGLSNVTIATGHGMMGLSLGPITGRIVSQIVQNLDTGFELSSLDPNRYA